MARPTLAAHPKFAKLVARLRGSPAPRSLATGALELIWTAGYGSGDPLVGDVEAVEAIADWCGAPGELASHLVATGFLDLDNGQHYIHDLADHAPAYVAQRMAREEERRQAGTTISEIRAKAARKRGEQTRANELHLQQMNADVDKRVPFPANVAPPAPAPAPAPADPEHSLPRDPTGLVQGGPVTGPLLTLLFGRERAKLWPEALEWVGTPTSPEKAANMAATIPASAIGTVTITMAMLLSRAKAGTHRKSAEIVKAPGFGFLCWCAEYHELLEEISGKAPRAPPANGASGANGGHRRDPRTGYAEPPPPGTKYEPGKARI